MLGNNNLYSVAKQKENQWQKPELMAQAQSDGPGRTGSQSEL
jgi:hypothetical protein